MESKGAEADTMWQVYLESPGHENITLRRVPIPTPKKGDVLIKVAASPINPRDFAMMLAKDQKFPFAPGDEGSGVVVKSGGGFMANRMVGKRVAFLRVWHKKSTGPPNGSYSEYVTTSSDMAFEVDKSIPDEVAACGVVNPLSALGLMERLKKLKAKTVIQTGAASQIAKMMIRLAPSYKMTFINIVRRDEQVEYLKNELNQEHVLNSSDPDFLEKFRELATAMNARHCLECVSGEMTGKLLSNMPDESVIVMYGSLSLQRISDINPGRFIYLGHRLEGFVLHNFIKELNVF